MWNRRHFLKASALAGLSVFTPAPFGARSEEPFRPFEGPFWIMLNAVGGWDTTLFCDPRGREISVKEGLPVNTAFSMSERVNRGTTQDPIWFAPEFTETPFYTPFLDAYGDKTLFINGVDSETNGHVQGERVTWSGELAPGYPSLAALIAAEKLAGYELPVPFLTFGGYDATGDLVTPTRLLDMDVFSKVAAPDVARFVDGQPETFLPAGTQALVDRAAAARLDAARAHAKLPRQGKAMDALYTARLSERNVERILDRLDITRFNELSSPDDILRRQGLLALTSFQAGVCVSANLKLTGWDTHNNNDASQTRRLRQLLTSLVDLWDQAEAMGLADKLNVIVASDFGRTPHHNASNGKDHWSVGSWMVMLGGSAPRTSLGMIGGTDPATMKARLLDPTTLTFTDDETAGVKLTPAHIHRALRKLAGIEQGAYAPAYPIEVPELALFG